MRQGGLPGGGEARTEPKRIGKLKGKRPAGEVRGRWERRKEGLGPGGGYRGNGGRGAWRIFEQKRTSSGLWVRKIFLAATWRTGAPESSRPASRPGETTRPDWVRQGNGERARRAEPQQGVAG